MKRLAKPCSNPACQTVMKRPPWRFRGVRQPTCSVACRAAVARGRPGRPGKGGRIVRGSRPYVRVPQHPLADGRGYVLEAILVAERVLGRPLGYDERVVLLDGVPWHVVPENLAVRSKQTAILLRDHLKPAVVSPLP